jgi:predicted Zn-dependent peptidase
MSNQARNEIYFQRTVSPDETLHAIDAVTSDEVTKLARTIFTQPLTLAVLGNLEHAKLKTPTVA